MVVNELREETTVELDEWRLVFICPVTSFTGICQSWQINSHRGSGFGHTSSMNRRTRVQMMEVIWPLFAALGAGVKGLYKIFFAWWLDSLVQRRANRKLGEDVQTNLHFLFAEGHVVREKHVAVLPFDYASVCTHSRMCLSLSLAGEVSLTYLLLRGMHQMRHTVWWP